jgi:hypothetical protein
LRSRGPTVLGRLLKRLGGEKQWGRRRRYLFRYLLTEAFRRRILSALALNSFAADAVSIHQPHIIL